MLVFSGEVCIVEEPISLLGVTARCLSYVIGRMSGWPSDTDKTANLVASGSCPLVHEIELINRATGTRHPLVSRRTSTSCPHNHDTSAPTPLQILCFSS